MGFMELGMIPASIFGAPIAFAFVENGSWRPIFWLSAGFNVVSFFGVLFFYHPLNQHIREDGKTVWDQLKETDLMGPGLFTAGTTLFLLGLSFGGHMYPWLSAQTLAPLLIGAALLVAVGLYSAYTTHKYACFPSHIFKNVRGFTVVLVGIFLYGMSLSSTPILWPQQVRLLYTQDSRAIGWYAMAMGIGGSWGGLVAGWIVKRYGSYHIVFPTVLALLTLFSGCQAIIHEDSQVASTALVILMGAVIAAAAVLAAAILQLGSHHAYIGIVSGMGTSARNAGGAVAQVVYVSILNQELTKLLAKNVAAPLARDGVPAADIPGIMQALLSHKPANPLLANLPPPLISKLNSGIKDSYIGSFRVVYLSTIAFGVVATLVACFTANLNDKSTHHVDVALEEGAHIHTHDASEGHILEKDEMGRTFIR
jgi:MFS family permease